MIDHIQRRSFLALHITLGLVLAFESARTLVHAATAHHDFHLGAVAAVETAAALLFLWPRTTRIGGGTLVAILVTGFLAHAFQGEIRAALLVYAAAALFVTVHGSAWKLDRQAAA